MSEIINSVPNGNRFINIKRDEMSALELIYLIIKYVNEIIVTNDKLSADMLYLLGEGLMAEVSKQMQELYDEGRLTGLFSTENLNIYKDREVTGYALDVANLSGQDANAGKGPNSPDQTSCRAVVIHNYVDSEPLLIDNVGEAACLFIRNARNPDRRSDKEPTYIGQSDFLRFQQGYFEEGASNHSFATIFTMNNNGDMYWRDNRADVKPVKIMTVSQAKSSAKIFQFILGAYYEATYLLDLQYALNKSAFKFIINTSGYSEIMSPSKGLKLSAYKDNMILESITGNVIIDVPESGNLLFRKNKVSHPLARWVNKPSSATASGSVGDYSADANYLYVCYGPDQWIRVPSTNW